MLGDNTRKKTPFVTSVIVSLPTSFTLGGDTGRPAASRPLFWRVAAGAIVAVCVALHWQVARTAVAPRTPWDENHVLQMARWIAGDHNVTPLSGAGYYPGWSFLMAPIWWFTHDAATVYAIAIVLGNAIAVATIIPLALTARRLGLTLAQGVAVGGLVMCLPARVVNADYVLSEKPLVFFLAWMILAALALWQHPSWWRMTLFALAVVATFFVHARALTFVAVAAVWLLFFLRRRVKLSIWGLALVAAGTLAVREYAAWIHSHVLLSGFSQGENLISGLLSASPSSLMRVTATQLWAQFVGTAGLFALGVVVMGIWVWREIRGLRVGIGGLLFGLTLITVVVSVASWADSPHLHPMPGVRFDASIYTRYLDPVGALLALVGLSALIRAVSRPIISTALASAAALSILVVFWVAPWVPTWGNLDGPANAAAILTWDRFFPTGQPFSLPLVPTFTNQNRFWLIASLFLLLSLTSFLLLRTRPRTTVLVATLVLAGMSVAADPTQSRDYPRHITAAVEDAERSLPGDDLLTVDFDRSCRDESLALAQMTNWLPYWLSPRKVPLVAVAAGDAPSSEAIVSCDRWPLAEELGARAYDGGVDYIYRLWILPGPMQDALEEKGKLLTPEELEARQGR